ncbi:MAG: endo-1,4-beta-xylanase [Proteobacteria bacterium]|nr:endo-1,4-beta-xylanase [Pseudomonadota bacterium]
MISRRAALAALAAIPAIGLAETLRPSLTNDGPSLRALAGSRGIAFGAATANFELRQRDFTFALLRDCGIIVPEYELKRDLTEPVQGQIDFSATDALLDFARRHGLLIRGHTLVWYASNPPWLEPAVAAAPDERIFTDYVRAAMRHYAGRMHSWDVVNEAIQPQDGRADALRDSFWLRKFGPSYIDTAFLAARDADPSALLVYNDYGLEEEGAIHDQRRRAVLKLLEGMIARGVPVGALGLQGHLAAFTRKVDQRKLEAFLNEVRATGLRILITEHDVDDGGGPVDFITRDRAVADATRRFLDVALDNRSTMALLTWGLSDRFLKPESMREQLLRGTPRSLPLDAALQTTPMRAAIADALRNARPR